MLHLKNSLFEDVCPYKPGLFDRKDSLAFFVSPSPLCFSLIRIEISLIDDKLSLVQTKKLKDSKELFCLT